MPRMWAAGGNASGRRGSCLPHNLHPSWGPPELSGETRLSVRTAQLRGVELPAAGSTEPIKARHGERLIQLFIERMSRRAAQALRGDPELRLRVSLVASHGHALFLRNTVCHGHILSFPGPASQRLLRRTDKRGHPREDARGGASAVQRTRRRQRQGEEWLVVVGLCFGLPRHLSQVVGLGLLIASVTCRARSAVVGPVRSPARSTLRRRRAGTRTRQLGACE